MTSLPLACSESSNAPAGTVPFVAAAVERLLYPILCTQVATPRDTFHEGCASTELSSALGVRIGSWVTVTRSSNRQTELEESFLVRLVGPGEGAEVCPATPNRKCGDLPTLHLPTNLLEQLRATPGRSVVTVALADEAGGTGDELPNAGRVIVARVNTPDMKRRYFRALRNFFCVPRVLREGEVFYVPFQGLPPQLRDIEETSAAGDYDSPDSSEGEAEQGNDVVDDFRPGLRQSAKSHLRTDLSMRLPCGGMLGFRVERIEPVQTSNRNSLTPDRRTRCFLVDRNSSELLVQGACNARGLPYITSHLFCSRPPPLMLSLQSAFERLLGLLAPAIRRWEQPQIGATAGLYRVLVTGPRGCGKRILWHSVCERLGLHLLEVNCYQLVSQGAAAIEDSLQGVLLAAARNSPIVVCFRRLQALTQNGAAASPAASLLVQRRLEASLISALQQAHESEDQGASQNNGIDQRRLVVLAGSCEDLDDLSSPIRKVFQVELKLERPNENARKAAIQRLLPLYEPHAKLEMSPEALAKLTAGLSYTDLRSVCNEVASFRDEPSGKKAGPSEEERIEQAVKRLQGGSKVAVTLASKVNWADIGGLQDAKDEVMNCITLPLDQGHLFAGQKVRSGILLFGPPGTGKTLLAKAVATECRVHFLSVKGPELLSMYIGESEKNVRNLFQNARELQPCVLFFDELDSLVPARGRGSDSGGVMDRVVSQLLTELDTMPATVFLIGATNRPDLLDRSLLRPGRLDRMVYLGVAKDKLPLLKAVTRKFILDESSTEKRSDKCSLLELVANHCPPNLTGADVAALCTDAYSMAQTAHIHRLDDLAAKLGASVTTLLLFLDALDQKSADRKNERDRNNTSNQDCCMSLVFAQGEVAEFSACVLDCLPMGLSLCRWQWQSLDSQVKQLPSHLLVRRANGEADAAVFLDPSEALGTTALEGAIQANAASRNSREWGWLQSLQSSGRLSTVQGLCPFRALEVRCGWHHFQEALGRLQPSVPMEDLMRYEQLAQEHQNTKK